MDTPHRDLGRAPRAIAVVDLVVHVIAAGGAMIMLPHGFGLTDIHLWSNTVIPAMSVIATAVVLVRFLFFGSSAVALSTLMAALAGGWLGAVVTGVVLFPSSMPLGRCAAAGGVALAFLAVAVWARERTTLTLVGLGAGAGLGFVLVLAQRAPAPSTRPLGGTLAEMRGEDTAEEAATGQVVVACGKGKLRLSPLLSFQSRSPDRTWTVLAPDEPAPHRALTHYARTPTGFRASYTDDGSSTLVAVKDKAGVLELDAVSKLGHPVYSHLNSWTMIHVSFDATLSFGPTGPTRFAIEPADYPTGRPAQLAYLAEDLSFRVVRARDAEKGPFTELAKGHLGRDEPLVLEIRPRNETDKTDKGCVLVFKDWSAQVSTEPSPTAGWGVPQNSIQFFTRGREGLILLTLAETGPGRGWDSVAHAEGTYRNRLNVAPLK